MAALMPISQVIGLSSSSQTKFAAYRERVVYSVQAILGSKFSAALFEHTATT